MPTKVARLFHLIPDTVAKTVCSFDRPHFVERPKKPFKHISLFKALLGLEKVVTMHSYIISPPAHGTAPGEPARLLAEPQAKCHIRPSRSYSMANHGASPQHVPDSKRRRISLPAALHRLTLREPHASLCQPGSESMHTTMASAQPDRPASYAFDRTALKTALYNLATSNLSRADFILLVNRYGYSSALHSFPLETLKPADWRAIKERPCLQIMSYDGSFFAQLAPETITCATCLTAYLSCKARNCCESSFFEQVPAHLQEAFFTELLEYYPLEILKYPSKERTSKRLLAACKRSDWELDGLFFKLPEHERTAELAIELCRCNGDALAYIPEAQRSYELCMKACRTSGKALLHVPHRHRDEELCRTALSTYDLAYQWFPEQLSQNYEWQLRACRQNGAVLQWIAKDQHDDALRLAACASNGEALRFIDPKQINYEMCRLACTDNGRAACRHIPDHLLDDDLRELICRTTDDPSVCIDFNPHNKADFYGWLLRENIHTAIEWVPQEDRSPALYLLACQNNGRELELVPEKERTPEICLAACRSYGAALQWVPEQHRTKGFCQMVCQAFLNSYLLVRKGALKYVAKGGLGLEWFVKALHDCSSQPDTLLIHAQRVLSAADFQSLLESSLLCANGHKLTMLTLKQISASQKEQLIEWIMEPGSWPTADPRRQSDLCEMASPLPALVDNPEIKPLEMAAIKAATHWTPPRYSAGQRLLNEIEQTLSAAVVELPAASEPLFYQVGETAGGRTLRIDRGEQAYYYKFQRKGESLKTLMQEGAIHTVRENHPELFGPLRSKLPGAARFFRLYLDQLPEVLPAFPDLPEICTDENNRSYVHVYRYVAPSDYSVYAHCVDLSHPDDPWHKGEQGIVTACHDIGLFVAMGLVPTSTLPAFHDSESGREWTALHVLLGYMHHTVYPGTFGAWNSVATEFCDFGYGGFRDVGDFEPFGKIENIMKRGDAQAYSGVPELEQCLCLMNAVCENLLAANLIRARLRQQGCDYHYKNPEAQRQNQAFIEQTLLAFLKGMYAERMACDNDSAFLRRRLKVDKASYEEWLSRAAAEMLYWTAKQPDPKHPEQPPFADSSDLYSHKDGYALHLNRTGHLDPGLYPDDGATRRHTGVFPGDFHNHNGRLNLGRNNAVFPLTTLMRGLMRLCTGMLTYNHTAADLPLVSE